MVTKLLEQPKDAIHYLKISQTNKKPIAARAAMLLEFAAKKNLEIVFEIWPSFFKIISNVNLDGSIRSYSKLCELIVLESYSKKTKDKNRYQLTNSQKKAITNCCFNWLIGENKVASKAHSMECLLWLGYDIDWVHPELISVLELNFGDGSAGYKSRARKVLNALKKQSLNS